MNEFKGTLVKVAGMTLKFEGFFHFRRGTVTLPRFPTQANPNEEMEFLKWQKEALEEELKQVKERLKNLEAETSENKPVT